MPRKKPTPSSISRPCASIARPRPANSSTPPSLPRLTAWSPPRPWRPSRRANGAASPAHPPQIPGDLFDRLGLRRIRAARLGQQPDSLRFELRRVFRAFCHSSIIAHRVSGNAEQKSGHISTLWTPSVFPICLYANWSNALLRFRQNCAGIQGFDLNLGMGDIYGRRAIRAVEFLITKLSGNCT